MSYERYKGRGLTGLSNLGNTCFMNSALQCLSHCYEFTDFLESTSYQGRVNKAPETLVLIEWNRLRKLMWSENCTVSPGGFLSSVQKVARSQDKVLFTGSAQNDLPEFLLFLIGCFHQAILREVNMEIKGAAVSSTDRLAETCFTMMKTMYKREYSEILDFFYGISVSYVTFASGDYVNASPEPFLALDLAVPAGDTVNLNDCLAFYTAKEELGGENMVHNDKTKKKELVNKQILFWSLPQLLIISLKRFDNDQRKNNSFVDFPLTGLNLSEYMVGYDRSDFVYDLFGICNHSGTVKAGHYTSFVKNADGKWYSFNDTRVEEVDTVQLKTPKAYCFFYRKKKS